MNEFNWQIRVYYEDTDAGGVVYYANYLKFLERARTEWLRQHGFEQDRLKETDNILIVVRHLTLNYLKPAKFNELLTVTVNPTKIGKVSLQLEQQIKRAETEIILCEGHIKLGCVDATQLRPTSLPRAVLATLTHLYPA